MKKIYLALICLMMSVSSVFAQNVVFTDGDGGAAFADGAIITRNHITSDPFVGSFIHSGLFVKNNGNASQVISIEMDVVTLPATSAIQICFPSNCLSTDKTSTIETATKGLTVGSSHDLPPERIIPQAYGQQKVIYRGTYYTLSDTDMMGAPIYEFTGYGPAITVIYDYADPAGIEGVESDKEVASESYYSILGRKMDVAKGLCIKKTVYTDGTQKCVKVVVK